MVNHISLKIVERNFGIRLLCHQSRAVSLKSRHMLGSRLWLSKSYRSFSFECENSKHWSHRNREEITDKHSLTTDSTRTVCSLEGDPYEAGANKVTLFFHRYRDRLFCCNKYCANVEVTLPHWIWVKTVLKVPSVSLAKVVWRKQKDIDWINWGLC